MGNLSAEFPVAVHLCVKDELQIRHNALESARLTANRFLEKNIGKQGFHMKVRAYPHHFLRENPLASGAGADRMSTGMKASFGKIIGLAAQFREGQNVYTIYTNPNKLELAKTALKKAAKKLPCGCNLRVDSASKDEQRPKPDMKVIVEKPEETNEPPQKAVEADDVDVADTEVEATVESSEKKEDVAPEGPTPEEIVAQ